jgi:hypothetical protein
MNTTDEQRTARSDGQSLGANGEYNRRSGELATGGGLVMKSIAAFGDNAFTLTQLQTKLLAIEIKQNLQTALVYGIPALCAGALFVAGLVVALLGVAELLASELELKPSLALLCVGIAATLIGIGSIAVAAVLLRRQWRGFPLSREEFERNALWVKTVLRQSGRARS